MMKQTVRDCWLIFLGAATLGVVMSSCTVSETGQIVIGPTSSPGRKMPYSTSGSSEKVKPPVAGQAPRHYSFIDEDLLSSLNQDNSRIEIDLGEQRARVFRTGGRGGDKLVIESQISTGKQGHNTPDGSFKLLEKSTDKKSNLYGKWVDSRTGALLVNDGDSRIPPNSPDAEFIGTPMPYWMRITPGGVGMHIGYVPNYPASHGCIRVPKVIQPLIYEKVKVGTPVTITH
ncbi:MAG: L,D-transpeptidase family protein [Verrucomicrobiae bacterium]|nr:L,D-transpeptidase family protein [Verrucomicrobiae bacterium]